MRPRLRRRRYFGLDPDAERILRRLVREERHRALRAVRKPWTPRRSARLDRAILAAEALEEGGQR